MEWLMMNAYGAHSISENIGYVLDGSYIVAEDCLDTLLDISEKLQTEDPVVKQFRRQLALMEVMKKDFVPLLLNIDTEEDAEIFCCLITVLADLTHPLECLDLARRGPGSYDTLPPMKIQEIAKLKADAQEAFQDRTLIARLFSIILSILRQDEAISSEQCRAVHHFFLFIQNLLYISQTNPDTDITSMSYNQCLLLRNFLKEGLSDIILTAMNIPQWYPFSDAIVQLLAVMYTDEMNDAGGLRRIRESVAQVENNLLLGNEESESEEAMDSSAPSINKNRLSSLVELLGVIGCLKDSLSISDTKEESTVSLNVQKTQVSGNHRVLQTEISLLLEEFEWKFLQTGFTKLVLAFVNQNLKYESGRGNFFYLWMMCYFLSIAHRNRVDFKHIRCVFLREVITLLTYQGFKIWLQIFSSKGGLSQVVYKQLHLVVSLFKEMLNTLQTYTAEEKVAGDVQKEVAQIKYDFATVKDLSKFFLLLIRTYKADKLGCLFLSDVIETNHLLLANMDEVIQEGRCSFNLLEHIKLYAANSIMDNYGLMLQSVETNDPNLNMMIFTMLHHVSGDCSKVEALLQPRLLLSLIKTSEINYPITEEVVDLMEYVFSLFINCVQSSPEKMAEILFPGDEDDVVNFTEEESDLAISFCFECNSEDDLVQTVTEQLKQNGVQKSKEEVCSFLTSMGYLNSEKEDNSSGSDFRETEVTSSLYKSQYSTEAFDDMLIKNCVDKLIDLGMSDGLQWLQSSLLQVWNAKLVLKGAKPKKSAVHWEPLAYFCLAQGENVPITVYSDNQEQFCKEPLFQSLIAALDFGKEKEGVYFIQKGWSPEKLLSMARLFGEVDQNDLMFSVEEADAFLSLKHSQYTDLPEHEADCGNSVGKVPAVLWPAAVKLLNTDGRSQQLT